MRGRYYQNIEQPETDNHSLIKRIQETSVVLSDLDGLLVNSENFNQVFVHRTSKAWMRSTISRVVKSDLHLRKFLQVLVSFITSERHPEWARHALVWLRFLLSNYPIPNSTWSNLRRVMAPLRSHANEMAGLHDSYVRAALRGTAVEQWFTQKKVENEETNRERLFYDTINGIPSTGFVFVDDSDEESSGKHSSRSGLPRQPTNTPAKGIGLHGTDSLTATDETMEKNNEDDNLLLGSDNEFDFISEEDEDEEEDEDDGTWNDSDQDEDESEDQLDPIVTTPSDSDHGVFDVNDTASSSSRDAAPNEEDDDDADEEEEEDDSEDADEGASDEDGMKLDDQQSGGDSNVETSDASSVVSETTSESDEETKFLLLGREIHKDPDEELSVASTTTAAATTTATVNHTPVNSPQSKRSPGKANLTDSKSPSPKKRRFSVSRT